MPDVSPPIPERMEIDATPTAPAPAVLVVTAGTHTGTVDTQPLVEIVPLLERELSGQKDGERRADLGVRLALLAWDLGDPEASYRHAAGALPHLGAVRLLVAHALASPSRE